MEKKICKGSLFWYRIKRKKYAALVLDEIGAGDYYLILISEEISGFESVEEIMELPAYTAAWFNSLEVIPSNRIHMIGETSLTDSFNGYAGGFFSDHTVIINNCGQSKTWKHEYCQLSFHGKKMREQIHCSSYNLMMKNK